MTDFPHAAKILRSTGIVENIEVADAAWVASENEKNTDYLYVSFNQGEHIGIGAVWDGTKFIPAKPYKTWTYDAESNSWQPPVPKPEDTDKGFYYWSEEDDSWAFQNFFEQDFVHPVENPGA